MPLLLNAGIDVSELEFETSFHITIGRAHRIEIGADRFDERRGFLDILYRKAGEPFLVIEVKREDVNLTDKDRDQAISYARLIDRIAPFAAVTNGHEFRLYDVRTKEPIDTFGNQSITLADEIDQLRDEAANLFVGISAENLLLLCEAQNKIHLSQHIGTPDSYREYSPDLYEPRLLAAAQFECFLQAQARCFAIVGSSGSGKTSFLCWLVLNERERLRPVFYYDAGLMTRSLEETLVADFAWVAGREATAAQVVSRLANLAQRNGTEMLFALDAIDETSNSEQFALELNELVQRVDGQAIRFCVGAKASDWGRFIQRASRATPLADATFDALPDEAIREMRLAPTADDNRKQAPPGTWLPPLEDAEFDRAWGLYSSTYNIAAVPTGELRVLCRQPFMMRITAESFANEQVLPPGLSATRLIERWFDRRYGRAVVESPARRVVGYIADAMIGRNRAVLSEVDAAEALQAKGVRDPEVAIAEAIRLGLLLRTRLDSPGPFGSRSAVVFPHDHLLQYAFVASSAWTQVTAEAMASAVTALGPPSLLAGVVQFCITTLDRQQDAIGLQLLRASPAAYAIVAGDGYDQGFADQLPDRVYLMRLLAAYRFLREDVFGTVAQDLEPWESAGDICLIARRSSSRPRSIDFGWTTSSNCEGLVLEDEPPGEPRIPGLGVNWQWWQQWSIGTVHTLDLGSSRRLLPEYEALSLALKPMRYLVGERGRGLDEAHNPALARVRVGQTFSTAFQEMGSPVRRYTSVAGNIAGLRVADWRRELDLHRHRHACLLEIAFDQKSDSEARGSRWQWILAEAERRQAAGVPPPPLAEIGASEQTIQCASALRVLESLGFETVGASPTPRVSTAGASLAPDGTRVLAPSACADYLRALLSVVLREYRCLVELNLPLLQPDLQLLRNGPVLLHLQLHPIGPRADQVRNPARTSIGDEVFVVPDCGLNLSMGVSPTNGDEVVVIVGREGERDWRSMTVDTPWGFRSVRPVVGTHLDRFFRSGVLLDLVYELLDRDLRLTFGDQLWGRQREYAGSAGMPGALRRI